ncbi:carboxymuconolactone decarboxylase family protein [Kribbella solani]|uniref:Alkylhydroperoxidase family enzyme n=1 Tax=Kribbella solani TaxID=236067 RepID=A0A841E6L0_9ACTN|nr:carboxymuconolactone decarboxylase family protein [Kribbella solani]MBB5983957.1 alkylhydroperoxidase family enzyme [Kribbella solani]MDX2972162.1 carboxymuconolactone decarboxylase family protein [Kribbella solani]MDX3006521.1 carboxymuconolactone decarboxylase family protein [Kribbella solani]
MARIGLEHRRTASVRLVEWISRRRFRKVPDPVKVALHHRPVLLSTALLEGTAGNWKALDPGLKALSVMVASAQIGCSWCMDFGYWEFHHQGVDPVKLRDVPRWRDSDVYTDLERAVMDYTEAMTATPPEVTDEQVERLRRDLSEKEFVELTAMVALENFRSRVNAAVGLTSQGFKEYCELRPAK